MGARAAGGAANKAEVSSPSDVAVARPASNGCPRLAGSPSESLHGWSCTTIGPLRRRLPDLFAPRGGKWRAWRDSHPHLNRVRSAGDW